MTSTVIDVSLFLLCVSVGVITITGASDLGATGSSTPGPDAGTVADLVATSTASVTYDPSPTTPDETTVTHHATLAELLATAVGAAADNRTSDPGANSSKALEAYETAVIEAVRSAVGTRTQVVAYRSTSSTADVLGAEAVDEAIVAGETPPPDGAIDVATIRLPVFQPELGEYAEEDHSAGDGDSVGDGHSGGEGESGGAGNSGRAGGHREVRAGNEPQYDGVRIVVRVW